MTATNSDSSQDPTQGLNYVEVSMAYSAPVEGDAYIRVYPPASGLKREAPKRERHTVRVFDCRPLADSLNMDVAGFALKRHATKFTDFFNEEAVRKHYYPEVVNALRDMLGAEAVFVFDHNALIAHTL